MSLNVEEHHRTTHSIRHGPRPVVLWFPVTVPPSGTEADKAAPGSLGIVTVPGQVGLYQKAANGSWTQLQAKVL